MTIYRALLDLGYSDAFIRKASEQSVLSREFGIFIEDTFDGEPIVGLRYEIDYRSEEESGRSELMDALGIGKGAWQMDSSKKNHIAKFGEYSSLIVSVAELDSRVYSWGHDITSLAYGVARGSLDGNYRKIDGCYDTWFTYSLLRAQGLNNDNPLTHSSIPKMKKMAENLGLTRLPKKKAELIKFLESTPEYTAGGRRPESWPGWFHYGGTLVLRANGGITASILDLIYETSVLGTMAMGYGEGDSKRAILIYDGEDVGPILKRNRLEHAEWVRDAELKLIPVETELNKNDYRIYFIGDPILEEDESGDLVTKYFLNVHLSGNLGQIMKTYTLDELREEKFIKDAEDRRSSKGIKSKV